MQEIAEILKLKKNILDQKFTYPEANHLKGLI